MTDSAGHDLRPGTRPIVVFGSVNMDLVARTPHLPVAGETVLGHDFTTVPGGKGGNQAIAAARAGGEVEIIGAVGRDEFGERLRTTLAEAGVGVDQLRSVAGSSGIAAITVDDAAENTIVVIPGANSTLTGLTDQDRALIAGAALLICQLEVPMPGVIVASGIAAAAGVPVLLNPSPARDLPTELLATVSILVVNEGESEAVGEESRSQVPHVITTLGARGATYRGELGGLDVAAPEVTVVDTTGAGDAFTGALAVAWAAGSPQQALQTACAAGALATTVAGASSSSPTAAEIEDLASATYRR